MKSTNSVLAPGWPIFLFLLLATLPNTFTTTLLSPGLPLLASELGGGARGISQAQMLMTFPGIGMLSAPLIGWLADRWGKRPILLVALVADTVAGLGCMVATDFTILLMLRFVLGVGVGALMAVSLSLIGDHYAGEGRSKMLGYRWAAMTFFSMLAVLAAGFLAESHGWAAPMSLYAVGVPLFIYALLRVKPTPPKMTSAELRSSQLQPLRETVDSVFIIAMIGNIFLAIASYSLFTLLPFLLREKGFFDPRQFSIVLSAGSFISIGAALYFSRLMRWMHPLAIIMFCLAIFGFGTILFASAKGLNELFIASIIASCACTLFEPALSSFLLERIHPSRRSFAMGGIFGTYHVGPFLTPLIFGSINTLYGFNISFLLLAGAALLAAIAFFICLRGRIRPDPVIAASA